jgi:hypothetical protein
MADSQSVSQYVLVSSPLCGRLTRYCFLFKSLGMEFGVLSLWGALSDERPDLSFVSHSLVICLCVHLLFTFLSFIPLPLPEPEARWGYFTTDSQAVSMSWCRAHFVDVWPDIASFFKSLSLEFGVLSLWGVLSDERPGLSFVRDMQNDFWNDVLCSLSFCFSHTLTPLICFYVNYIIII